MLDKLLSIMNTRALIAIGLTGVFCYLACIGSLSELFMSVYTTVILFYFVDTAKGDSHG